LCFEKRFSKQNSVIRVKSNILPPQISGRATPLVRGGIEFCLTLITTYAMKKKTVAKKLCLTLGGNFKKGQFWSREGTPGTGLLSINFLDEHSP